MEQAASLLLLSEVGKTERHPDKNLLGEIILSDAAHKNSYQHCALPLAPFGRPFVNACFLIEIVENVFCECHLSIID